jgi:hypothetical protein
MNQKPAGDAKEDAPPSRRAYRDRLALRAVVEFDEAFTGKELKEGCLPHLGILLGERAFRR